MMKDKVKGGEIAHARQLEKGNLMQTQEFKENYQREYCKGSDERVLGDKGI